MKENNVSGLDAEFSLNSALIKIEQGLIDLERFKSASNSLDQASRNSSEILSSLLEASKLLDKVSENLSDKSLSDFERKLEEANDNIQKIGLDIASKVDGGAKDTEKHLEQIKEMNEQQQVIIGSLTAEVKKSNDDLCGQINNIKLTVIFGFVGLIGMVGFGFFKLGVLGLN
jgi:ribosome-binding ATPase YchF (GTP1/OBG family)